MIPSATSSAVFKKVMDINFYGTLYATKYALPHILKSKGSIVGISSINGYRGTPARTAYTASKYAMNGFFESLRTVITTLLPILANETAKAFPIPDDPPVMMTTLSFMICS
jgi:NAD(P)-dependent dehydrogenase (short-subunit alcohol dehydrogenase family)